VREVIGVSRIEKSIQVSQPILSVLQQQQDRMR
jgi:hypothetical protein